MEDNDGWHRPTDSFFYDSIIEEMKVNSSEDFEDFKRNLERQFIEFFRSKLVNFDKKRYPIKLGAFRAEICYNFPIPGKYWFMKYRRHYIA